MVHFGRTSNGSRKYSAVGQDGGRAERGRQLRYCRVFSFLFADVLIPSRKVSRREGTDAHFTSTHSSPFVLQSFRAMPIAPHCTSAARQ